MGRFLQPSQRIGCKPAPALSFLSWPFFVWPGCKPANQVRIKVRTFRVAAIPHRPALTGLSARLPTLPGANRKPCKPCFLVGRWRNAALAPPVLEYRQEGPLSPGTCTRAPTITKWLRPSPSSPPSQIVPGFPVPGRERLTGWERLNPVLARTSIVPGSNRSQGWGGNDCFSDSLCRSTLYKSFPVPGRCSLKRG